MADYPKLEEELKSKLTEAGISRDKIQVKINEIETRLKSIDDPMEQDELEDQLALLQEMHQLDQKLLNVEKKQEPAPIIREPEPRDEREEEELPEHIEEPMSSDLFRFGSSDDLQEETQQMPEFSRKTLFRILLWLNRGDQEASYNAEYELAQTQLKGEKLVNNEVLGYLESSRLCTSAGNFSEAKSHLIALLDKLIPLNVPALCKIIQTAEMSIKQLENKDLLLLLGNTGVGKSTTVHYLVGTPLARVTRNGHTYIAPTGPQSEEMKSFTVSPHTRSETKHMNAVRLPLPGEDNCFVCDSPGFYDTEGVEIDIANSVLIAKTAQVVKTLRIAFLISNKSIGDRLNLLPEILNTLLMLIPKFEKNQEALLFLFTKFKPDDSIGFCESLKDLVSNGPRTVENYTHFLQVIRHIKKLAKKKEAFLDPLLAKKRSRVLDLIRCMKPLKYPKESVKQFSTQKSIAKLDQYMRSMQNCLENSLSRGDHHSTQYLLKELKQLEEATQYQQAREAYAEMYKKAKTHFVSIATRAAEDLMHLNFTEVRFKPKALEEYRHCHDVLRRASGFLFDDDNLTPLSQLENALTSVAKSLVIKAESLPLDASGLEICYSNLVEMASLVPQIKTEVETVTTRTTELLREQCKNAKDFLEAGHFNEFGSTLSSLSSIKWLQNDTTSLSQNFQNILSRSEELVIDLFKRNALSPDDVKSLETEINKLHAAAKSVHLPQDYCKQAQNIYKSVKQVACDLFGELSSRVSSALQSEQPSAFNSIPTTLKLTEDYMKVRRLRRKHHHIYKDISYSVQTFMETLARKAEQLIEALSSQKQVNSQELERVLKVLNSMKETEQVGQYVRTHLFEDIKYSVKFHLSKQKNQVNRYIFKIDKLETLTELGTLVDQAESMQEATHVLEGLNDEYEHVFSVIEAKLQPTFERIHKYFDSAQLQDEKRKPLDQNFVDHSYAFLEYCMQTIPRFNRASVLYDQLNSFLPEYLGKLKSEIDHGIETLSNTSSTDTDNQTDSAGRLSRAIQEAFQWKKLHQVSSKDILIPFSDYITRLTETLQEFQEAVEKQIERAFHSSDHHFVELAISRLDRLSRIDKATGENSFGVRHQHWDKRFREEFGLITDEIENCLRQRDFTRIPELVSSAQNENIKRRYYSKISASLQALVEDFSSQVESVSSELGRSELIDAQKTLKRGQSAIAKLRSGLSDLPLEMFTTALKRSIEQLRKKFKRHIDESKELWDANQFATARARYKHIEEIKLSVPELFSDEEAGVTVPSIDQLVTELQSKIDSIELEDCMERPPKILYEQVEQSVKDFPLLSSLCENFKSKLLRQISTALDNLYENAFSDTNTLKYLENIVVYLPEEIQGRATGLLEQHSKRIESREIVLGDLKLQLADAESFRQHLKQYKTSSREFEAIRSFLLECIKTHLKEIRRMLTSNEVSQAIEKTQKFCKCIEVALEFHFAVEKYETKLSESLQKGCTEIVRRLTPIKPVHNPSDSKKLFEAAIQYAELPPQCVDLLRTRLRVDISSLLADIQTALNRLFSSIKQEYEHALATRNCDSIKTTLETLTRWTDIFELALKLTMCHQAMQSDLKLTIEYLSDSTNWTQALKQAIDSSTQVCEQFDIAAPSLLDHNERESTCRKVAQSLAFLESATPLFQDLPMAHKSDFFQEGANALSRKVTDTINQHLSRLDDTTDLEVYSALNAFYKVLQSLETHTRSLRLLIENKTQVEEEVNKKLDSIYQATQSIPDPEEFSINLIRLKAIGGRFQPVRKKAKEWIGTLLLEFRGKCGLVGLNAVRDCLIQKDHTGYGHSIIDEQPMFTCARYKIWQQKTTRSTISDLLDALQASSIDKERTISRFNTYHEVYKQLIQTNSRAMHDGRSADLSSVQGPLLRLTQPFENRQVDADWAEDAQDQFPDILGHLFALWTLQRTVEYNEVAGFDRDESVILEPHPAQVLAVFRVLGIGYDQSTPRDTGLVNNLVQVSTGEGKSLVVAISAALLALIGFEVSCVCYSEYLCKRDYGSFKDLFMFLGVDKRIQYKTFNMVCEGIINAYGEVRSKVIKFITTGDIASSQVSQARRSRKVLLIDEVDVFFKEEFFGSMFSVSTLLKNGNCKKLMDYIWEHRNSTRLTLVAVKQTECYSELCQQCPGWSELIDGAIVDMIASVNEIDSHQYIVQDGKIGYAEHDGVSFTRVCGYSTTFAYYKEFGARCVSPEQAGIHIKCGNFLYSELLNQFQWIIGVTGTLETLSDVEKEVIQDKCSIHHYSIIPSVFPSCTRAFDPSQDLVIGQSKQEYFSAIRRNISEAQAGHQTKRPVLVFFETVNKLKEFEKWLTSSSIQSVALQIHEALPEDEKQQLVLEATLPDRVTLLTRVFGRGTDFMCHNRHIQESGGVHVIQTFFSEDVAEEVQIIGRTARQGSNGSYAIVLLKEELEKFQVFEDCPTYNVLRSHASTFHNEKIKEFLHRIDSLREYHQAAHDLLQSLARRDFEMTKKLLLSLNHIHMTEVGVKKTILAFDATSSMSSFLERVKSTIHTMFERIAEILKSDPSNRHRISIRAIAYRNYNSRAEHLLLASDSLSDPNELLNFLSGVKCSGGWGNEAVEVALWYANQQSDISQVILIGDAPANTLKNVSYKRGKEFGETYWSNTQFAQATTCSDEVAQLKAKGIPVHTFYLEERARTNFEEIATETGGMSSYLDIAAPNASDQLLNLMTENILRSVDERFAEQYTRTYASN